MQTASDFSTTDVFIMSNLRLLEPRLFEQADSKWRKAKDAGS
jgi:hypothetical protein